MLRNDCTTDIVDIFYCPQRSLLGCGIITQRQGANVGLELKHGGGGQDWWASGWVCLVCSQERVCGEGDGTILCCFCDWCPEMVYDEWTLGAAPCPSQNSATSVRHHTKVLVDGRAKLGSHKQQHRIEITFRRSPKRYYGCMPWMSTAHHRPKTARPRTIDRFPRTHTTHRNPQQTQLCSHRCRTQPARHKGTNLHAPGHQKPKDNN